MIERRRDRVRIAPARFALTGNQPKEWMQWPTGY